MLIDARELESGTVLRSDLCIIGTGAAGITIARELAGTATDVIVLESGDFEPDSATQDLYVGDVVGEPLISHHEAVDLDQTRLRQFGGTTNHWAGFCRPLEEIDFETRAYLDTSGWPIGRDELVPYWERATAVLRLADSTYDLDWWQTNHGAPPPLLNTEIVTTSVFQVHFPFSFHTYRSDLETAPNIRLLIWANATGLTAADNADRIDSIAVQTLSGTDVTIEAGTVVLATGGIENPRLLLASNDVRTAGIGNSNDLVGRYFTEHLQVLAGFAVLNRSADQMQLYGEHRVAAPWPEEPDNRVSLKGALTIAREALLEHELLGMEAQLLAAPPAPGAPEYVNGLRTDDVQPLVEAIAVPDDMSIAYVQVLAEQKLQRDSRVMLGSDVDALGVPRTSLDWRHSDDDRASILAGLRLIGTELGRLGLGRLQITAGGFRPDVSPSTEAGLLSFYKVSVEDASPADFPLGIGFHHLCTTRMSDDPTHGVVDKDCRVHDVGNLYVAGSSVFSTGGVATPTFTITALALRLADHLRDNVL